MIIQITIYYKDRITPSISMYKVPKNWLIIVEKTEEETTIKCGIGETIYTFKNENVEKYEIEKM